MFGRKEELDPVYWMLGAALGWGGLPAEDASYVNVVPEMNDGQTAYTLTVKDVPVGAFWSVTLYDREGWMPINEHDAYSFNNVAARKTRTGASQSISATQRSPTSCPSYRDGIALCVCISRTRKSWMEAGRFQIWTLLNELWICDPIKPMAPLDGHFDKGWSMNNFEPASQ